MQRTINEPSAGVVSPDARWRYPKRISLAQLPTPIEKLDRLSHLLGGPEIYIKREDQTGLAAGGNKTRKLEFVVSDALTRGANHLLTIGSPQSNHVRQTAAAAAKLGLGCTLVLRGDPQPRLGNLLLDELLGADIHFAGDSTVEEYAACLMKLLLVQGRRPYMIPLGASTGLGAIAYVAAMEEALEQLRWMNVKIDSMIMASSSGGTQAGIVLGKELFSYTGQVLGISVDVEAANLIGTVRTIALEAAEILEATEIDINVDVNANYRGGGYAVVGELEQNAIRTVARMEGILLDPVYSGKAMGALIDLVTKRYFSKSQKLLFWHTGGIPALSAFAEKLAN